MMRSPLILGANLTKLDAATTELITNRDVLDVDQYAHDQRQVTVQDGVVVWTSSGTGNTRYLALFNLGERENTVKRSYAFYNLPAGTYGSRELWSHQDRGRSDGVNLTLPPHGCVLLELKP
jgi:hypothetical protein